MDQVKSEIEKGHFVRAVFLAESAGLSRERIQDVQKEALWQMSALYRNAPGTKKLAEQCGLSKRELKEMLETMAKERRKQGNEGNLEPRYDLSTGKYVAVEEWMDLLARRWDKL